MGRVCEKQTALSDSCDAGERLISFIAKKNVPSEENPKRIFYPFHFKKERN